MGCSCALASVRLSFNHFTNSCGELLKNTTRTSSYLVKSDQLTEWVIGPWPYAYCRVLGRGGFLWAGYPCTPLRGSGNGMRAQLSPESQGVVGRQEYRAGKIQKALPRS